MARRLKTAVVGVGYLGRFHAQKYKALEGSELVGVVDADPARARAVGEELGVPWHTHAAAVLDAVDAVSVVTPTVHHHAMARPFLLAGKHVLLEKPFAATLEEARDLLELSERAGVVLQIGHLERFNAAFTAHQHLVERPRYVEAIRIAPFPKRATDVDVVLDLMIHDIDLVAALVGEPPEPVDAVGVGILTDTVDIAHARLRFPGGCVANLTASRVSAKAERTVRLFQDGLYLSLDFGKGTGHKVEHPRGAAATEEDLKPVPFQLEKGDALMEEVRSFLEASAAGGQPKVTARDGLRAMEVAWKIRDLIARSGPA